jgi:hypothetical protein
VNGGRASAEEPHLSEGPPASAASRVGPPPAEATGHSLDTATTRVPRYAHVLGTGRHYFWGRRDNALVIWSLEPTWSVAESFLLDDYDAAFRRFLALERSRHRVARWVASLRALAAGPPYRSRRWLTIGVFSVAVATLVLLLVSHESWWGASKAPAALQEGPDPTVPSSVIQPHLASAPPGERVYVDADAGYRFFYPETWTRSGSTIIEPNGDVIVSVGAVPSGPLSQESGRILDRLTARYATVEIVSNQMERTSQGRPALAVGVEATDRRGHPIRLLAITVRGPEHSASIIIRFSAVSDPLDALPAIRRMVASFRIM